MAEQTAKIELPKWKTQAATVVSWLLGVGFLIAGFIKVIMLPGMREDFANWQYPMWFLIFTGLVEVAAAVLVVIQRTRYYGAMIIACVMAGAIITLLKYKEPGYEFIAPVAFLIMANFVMWVIRQQRGKKKSSPV